MLTRKIGDTEFNPIGFGAMGIGGVAYGTAPSDEERFKFLDRLLELGCTHWDSADVYGSSEELIGKYFEKYPERRSKVFLASKFGFAANGVRGDPEYVNEAIDRTLKRFGLPYIDLYYQHRVDSKTPIEETIKALAGLVKEGKIRYVGMSEPSPNSLRRAHAVHPISALQVEYSPFVLDIEQKGALLETARELGIPIVAYSPLGRGLITGQYKSWADLEENDFRKTIPKYSEKNFPKILQLADKIKDIGIKRNATPGQVTLAWLLAQGPDIIPIPGTKKIKYLEENMGALNVQLSDEEIAEIRRLCESAEVSGDRYESDRLQLIGQDTPPPAV